MGFIVGGIGSGLSMSGTGTGMVISSYVAIATGSTNYFIGTLKSTGKAIVEGRAIYVRGSSVYVVIHYGKTTTGGSAVAKLDSDMTTILWQRDLIAGTTVTLSDIKVDSQDNVYIVGYTDGTTNASNNAVILKYNSSGVLQWQRQLGTDTTSTWDDEFYKLVIDSSDNIYVSGMEATGVSHSDALVVKYDSTGSVLWRRKLGLSSGSSDEWAYAIGLDSANNVYLSCGNNYPSNTLGFVAKYDSSGTAVWQSQKYGTNNVLWDNMTTDSSGNMYIAGSTSSVFNLVKFNNQGVLQWSRNWAEGATTTPNGIVRDSQGYLYVCIKSNQTSFGVSTEYDLVVLKFDTSGGVIWQRRLGPTVTGTGCNLYPGGISIDSSDNVYVIGTIDSNNFTEAIIAKLPNDGSLTGTYTLNSIVLNYAATSLTLGTRNHSTAALSLIDQASTCTETTGTITDSASTAVINSVNVISSSTAYFAGRLTSGGISSQGGIDKYNNVYVSSYSSDQTTMYLAKYNSVGAIQWQKSFTKSGAIFTINKMVVDTSGNSYFTGLTDTTGLQCIVVKVDSSGTIQWQKTLGTAGQVMGQGIAVDLSGNVYIAGSTGGANPNMVLAKYNSAGTIQWQRTLTGASSDYGSDIGVDNSGNVYIVGYTNSVGYGSNDIYLAKYDSSGTLLWQKGTGSATAETGVAIAVSDTGVSYITGSYTTGAFVARIDTNGNTPTWVRRFSNVNGITFNDIALDTDYNVYAVGYTNSDLVATDRNMVIFKFNLDGTILWQRDLGYFVNGSSQDYATSVAVDGLGNLCIFGYSNASSTNDVLFAKVPIDGSNIGSYTIGSTSYVYNTNGLPYSTANFTTAARTLTAATSTFTDATISLTSAVSALTSTTASWTASSLPATQRAIFGYGYTTGVVSMTNLVGNTGVVATDTTGVGTARRQPAAAGYGGDKAMFVNGTTALSTGLQTSNLVSNAGIVATDSSVPNISRWGSAAAGYGGDKAILGYGQSNSISYLTSTELISNTGVWVTNQTGAGTTARTNLAAAGYGGDKAIFGFGSTGLNSKVTNLVSNTGVVAADVTVAGSTQRSGVAAAGYGGDKAIFGFGTTNVTNLVSNTGVVATDTAGVGTTRNYLAAAKYGSDKAIFGYGNASGTVSSITNLVSNTGVVATDTTGVGTARTELAAAGFSFV
jgi:uncharacterized delta-60 repeat protein